LNPSTPRRTAIVTGANRGIGLEICRHLARLDYRVILTSRDKAQGQDAAKTLPDIGGEILHHQLDVTNQESILRLRDFVVSHFGAADVLINNAAILPDSFGRILKVDVGKFRAALETNTLGPLMLCQAFIPMMRAQDYGRVVNVSSGAGQIKNMLNDMPAYRLSKIALNGLTLMLAKSVKNTNVLVNAACPGWVRSDMGGPRADRSLEQGADGIIWLATLPDGGPSGGFFRDRKPIPW
jgi:NAD(P)-dependent dehydrogenase (short-subunit alcohol dehydrogenase family)